MNDSLFTLHVPVARDDYTWVVRILNTCTNSPWSLFFGSTEGAALKICQHQVVERDQESNKEKICEVLGKVAHFGYW